MEIQEIKNKMKSYTDFFGGDLDHFKIDQAETLKDLYEILQDHNEKFSDMATDAERNLDRFRQKIGLYMEPEEN